MDDPAADDAALDAARRELYRLPPEQVLAARDELIAAADDAAFGQALRSIRKPTLAAWIVNSYASATPALVADLHDLHQRLLDAHAGGEIGTLRELTRERRDAVARHTRDASEACGRAVSAGVADDVLATFDAAVADPDVAVRLGSLQRGERWSGLGVSTTVPELSLVPAPPTGARTTPDERTDSAHDSPLDDGRLAEAREAFEQAEGELAGAQAAEDELAHRIRRLTTRLTTLQHDLEQARRDQAAARTGTAAARKARRVARSALDRAERRAAD